MKLLSIILVEIGSHFINLPSTQIMVNKVTNSLVQVFVVASRCHIMVSEFLSQGLVQTRIELPSPILHCKSSFITTSEE